MAIVASETYTSTSAPIQYAAITAFQDYPDIDEYLRHSRRILKALGNYVFGRLAAKKVTMPAPKGAFYLFPNFNFYRDKLKAKGILTSFELCETLLKEIGVAILPGTDFGRQPEELTCRIAYVDFDGEMVLESAMNKYKNELLSDDFILNNCRKMVEAVTKLEEWLDSL